MDFEEKKKIQVGVKQKNRVAEAPLELLLYLTY